MRAGRCDRFGGPEVLVPADVPDPVAGRHGMPGGQDRGRGHQQTGRPVMGAVG
ncbi:hypothetical protein Daura_13730 [Dactylosporangium aurantiacum]|uniref:Uncharacterized protein n=1 Tax=Dactylosporangium aurantiacum TaxID=35754 RepID=A0A9Q9IK77_9ACTN|nr:hypothetical protein [Dactylosporangium aurantiacum]MDG6105528.1 hypothetical protein [Dactylosporangium aurantiacum]UWZ57126.1 hypothetical protein Daura_13730 [Dactylosporangium aurantiacum]